MQLLSQCINKLGDKLHQTLENIFQWTKSLREVAETDKILLCNFSIHQYVGNQVTRNITQCKIAFNRHNSCEKLAETAKIVCKRIASKSRVVMYFLLPLRQLDLTWFCHLQDMIRRAMFLATCPPTYRPYQGRLRDELHKNCTALQHP